MLMAIAALSSATSSALLLHISEPEEEGRLQVPVMVTGLTVALAIGVFYVGIFPRHLYEVAEEATNLLFV